MKTIISLHMPKTAGSSFRKALEEHYKEKFLPDYTEPLSEDKFERRRKALTASIAIGTHGLGQFQCIHGHFLAVKYLLLASRQKLSFVTWLRNPVDRLVSHYYFWNSDIEPINAIPLYHQMINERWSLEQFCLSPRLRNIYTQYIFGVPLEAFSFIGITEHYSEDIKYFSQQYVNTALHEYHMNKRMDNDLFPAPDNELRRKIESYHKQDMELYTRARSMREQRRWE